MDTEYLRGLLRELANTKLVEMDIKWALKHYKGKQLQNYFLECVEEINEGDEEKLPEEVIQAYNELADKWFYDVASNGWDIKPPSFQPKQQQVKQPVKEARPYNNIEQRPRRKFCFD